MTEVKVQFQGLCQKSRRSRVRALILVGLLGCFWGLSPAEDIAIEHSA
jgi:hypothetical protein